MKNFMKKYGYYVSVVALLFILCIYGKDVKAESPEANADFEITDDTLVKYTGNEENVVIPDGVKKIGHRAFSQNETIKTVTVPEGVTNIDYYAFYSCGNLNSVSLPSTLKVIDLSAFYLCRTLKKIVVPNGVNKIGRNAFAGCEELEDIEIPDSVTSIGGNAFFNTKWLKEKQNELTASEPCLVINGNLIDVKTDLKAAIQVPDTVKVIVSDAFTCSLVTKITIPDSVTTIENGCFNLCPNLVSVKMADSVVTFGDDQFEGCPKLATVIFSDSITSLQYTFCDNPSLKTVELPENLTTARGVFWRCKNLKKVIVHKKLKSIISLFDLPRSAVLFVDKGSYAEKYASKLKGKYRVAYAYNGTKLITYTVKKSS